MSRYLLDLSERVGRAYAVTFIGLLLANGFDYTNLSSLRIAAVAAVPAALTVIKGALAKFVGDPDTASLRPTPAVIRR